MESLRASLAPNVPLADNQAKLLARRLHRKIALLYGTGEAGDAVACRWKRQFNENSKSLAFQTDFSDLLHSELSGWRLSLSQAENLAAVFIRSPEDDARTAASVEAAKAVMFGKAEILEVWTEGETALARLMTGSYLGDFASLYLAFLNRVDPSEEAPLRLPEGNLPEAKG